MRFDLFKVFPWDLLQLTSLDTKKVKVGILISRLFAETLGINSKFRF